MVFLSFALLDLPQIETAQLSGGDDVAADRGRASFVDSTD
jgi:hypothetical protein